NEGAARRGALRLVALPQAPWWRSIADQARHHALEPRLVQAVIQVESGFDPRAVSSKGAMGLMQLMPDTARLLRVSDPFDPEQNIRGGTLYLRQMIDSFQGRLELGLAAYNAGPNAVRRYAGIPPYDETRNYVQRVLSLLRGEGAPLESFPSPLPALESAVGRKVFLRRDAGNRWVVTTADSGR
ncbi:MAG TPA: lytic transglycosylase domain-containing protein, partial [Thermoanaerobaculia bacterium]|nr:lytic transglycosylase domain-containing protein [Thermoanaerobaculia bacterium]